MNSRTTLLAVMAGFIAGIIGSYCGSYLGKIPLMYAQSAIPDRVAAREFDVIDASGDTVIQLYTSGGVPAVLMQTAQHAIPRPSTYGSSVLLKISGMDINYTDSNTPAISSMASIGAGGLNFHAGTGNTIRDFRLIFDTPAPALYLSSVAGSPSSVASWSATMEPKDLKFSVNGLIKNTYPPQ